MIGTTVGHFRVVGLLGRGASGTVYAAVDEILGRDVALKILNPRLVDPDAVARFRAEATTLAKLRHPGIATIYELFESNGNLAMVMESVDGETLDRFCDRIGPMSPDRAAAIVDRMLSALGHAHDAGVLHRDVKPANVMVNGDVVTIMDFGIARMLGAERTGSDEGLLGTPGYMAPEQVLGHPLDARTDLYAVGVIFYRLLSGKLPFDGDTPVAVLQRQIAEPPAPLDDHRSDLPAWCDRIVRRALAKSPADRFQSAIEFREALPTVPTRAALPAVSRDEPARRLPVYEGLALAAIAALVGTIAVGAMRASNPPTLLAARTIAASVAQMPATPPPAVVPIAVESAAAPPPPALRPPAKRLVERLEFDAKAVVDDGRKMRERDATLVLSGSMLMVIDADAGRPLYALPYDSVASISYSHSREPLWRSPAGAVPVMHVQAGGVLRTFGISVARGWVSLRTTTGPRFIVLRVDEAQVTKMLAALQERTRLTPERLGDPVL